jgi:hypothetical protein
MRISVARIARHRRSVERIGAVSKYAAAALPGQRPVTLLVSAPFIFVLDVCTAILSLDRARFRIERMPVARRASPPQRFEEAEDRYIVGHCAWRRIAADPTKRAEIAVLEREIEADADEMVAIEEEEVARLDTALRAADDPQTRQRRSAALAIAQRRRDGIAQERLNWHEDRKRMARRREGDAAAASDGDTGR